MFGIYYYYYKTEFKKIITTLSIYIILFLSEFILLNSFYQFWKEKTEIYKLFLVAISSIAFIISLNDYIRVLTKHKKAGVLKYIGVLPQGVDQYVKGLIGINLCYLVLAYFFCWAYIFLGTRIISGENVRLVCFCTNIFLIVSIILLIIELVLCAFIEETNLVYMLANLLLGIAIVAIVRFYRCVNMVMKDYMIICVTLISLIVILMVMYKIAVYVMRKLERCI